MLSSLAQRIQQSQERIALFHTSALTREILEDAISRNKSIDIDIAIDESGHPFIGHSLEYYHISWEEQPITIPFREAIELLEKSDIPIILDCKEIWALPFLIQIIERLWAHRILVHIYAREFRFSHFEWADHDYPSEWIDMREVANLKKKYPNITTTASCKYLDPELLKTRGKYTILNFIRETLVSNNVDTICLNVTDNTIDNETLNFFLEENIIPHVTVDAIDASKLTSCYLWESDFINRVSDSRTLGYT